MQKRLNILLEISPRISRGCVSAKKNKQFSGRDAAWFI